MFEKSRVCGEWDMCWFCSGCGDMKSWRTKGYFRTDCKNGPYCEQCKNKIEKGEKIIRVKSRH